MSPAMPRLQDAVSIPIDEGWLLCSTAPGSAGDPSELLSRNPAWIAAHCPGTVAGALIASGCSSDLRGIDIDSLDWWYQVRFAGPASNTSSGSVLRCDGLATLAEVWLNGRIIGRSTNMFVASRFPTGPLMVGDNELYICFRSVSAHLAARRPRPRWRTPMVSNQQLRFVRTTLLGRTPGWSPPYPAVGPWKAVSLEQGSDESLTDISVRAEQVGTSGEVRFKATAASGLEGELHLDGPAGRLSAPLHRTHNQLCATISVETPELWWPHTHGKPVLYQPSIELRRGGRLLLNRRLSPIGFRKIDVDTSDDGFRLLVNGTPIFCRGACWTPLSATDLRSDSIEYETALRQVADCGMNMVRVGGTMVYEEDAFYEVASRLGLLVWQDFMFANMDYPASDPEFADSVTREVREFLQRVGAHPCLTVLCGNSEGEQQAAMWGAQRPLWSPALFHSLIPKLCAESGIGARYWPSSAHGGAFPHQVSAGTSSYYGVGAYLRPLEDARRSNLRFATESLAFANVPDPTGLALMPGGDAARAHSPEWKARSPRDLGAGWDFDDVRDYYLRALYHVDPQALRAVDHDRYLMLSRSVSADVMLRSFAEWRRTDSSCGGALIWFLRDLWKGAGWGVIAADGRPKAAWYGLRRILQPRAVFFTDEGVNGLDLYVANESPDVLDASVRVSCYARGEIPVTHIDIPVQVSPHWTKRIQIAAYLEEFIDLSYSYRFGAPPADVVAATLLTADGATAAEAFHLPSGLLPDRRELDLTATGRILSDGGAEVQVRSKRFARSVVLDVEGALPEDNHFDLAPGTERRIRLMFDRAPARWAGSVTAINSHQETLIAWSATAT